MPPSLLALHEMPTLTGLVTPREFYLITKDPAPLAGMPYPKASTPWEVLFRLGIRHIVRLEMERLPYDPSPLSLLLTLGMQDLVDAGPPRDPEAEQRMAMEAVSAILSQLKQGEGVIVHCVGGTGRTGTVLGCCLVGLGHPAQQVITYLDQLNKLRGKKGWPESAWQSELVSRFASLKWTLEE